MFQKIIEKKKQLCCMGLALLFAYMVTAMVVEAKQTQIQKGLAKEVLRFHVLANSNSDKDQELKLLVKENVITYMKKQLSESADLEATKTWVTENLSAIRNVAIQTLKNEGCEDSVRVELEKCRFPEKTYGDVCFPKGEYDALRICIGEAKGRNWWCVLYPNLCFMDAVHAVVPEEGKEELKQVLDEEAYEFVTTTHKIRVKWFFFR